MTTRRIALISILAAALATLHAKPLAAQMIYVTSQNSKAIAVVQGSTNSLVTTISTAPYIPGAIAVTPDTLWAYVANHCSSTDPGSVTVVDLTKNSVANVISVGSCPSAIAVTPDGSQVYVANRYPDDSISVIDTTTSPPSVSATIPNVLPGAYPDALAVSPDGTKIYVSTPGSTYAYDTTPQHNFAGSIASGEGNITLSPSGELWASGGALLTMGTRGSFSPSCTAGQVVFTSDGARAFLVDSECGDLYDIDVATLGINRVISHPRTVCAYSYIGISSNSTYLYDAYGACGGAGSDVSVLDVSNDTFPTFIPIGGLNGVSAIAVAKTKPTITWPTPSAIVYGTPLSDAQLNATASVPGTFAYTPPMGTVLTTGTQTLSVTFTPTDTIRYAPMTATVHLIVNQATPVITWPTPGPVVTGTALSGTQLNAMALVPGSFVYSPPAGTVVSTGLVNLSATFTPADTTNYTTATAMVTLTVTALATQAPAITSANSATFAEGVARSFLLTATGIPTPMWGEIGALPTGITLIDNANGTATLGGFPATGTAGIYSIQFMASNGVGTAAAQTFSLTVSSPLAIATGNSTTFTVGSPGWFSLATTGFPIPKLTESGSLPAGVTFTDNGDGTATLSGTPATQFYGTISITASNGGINPATQSFTLSVNTGPAIATGNVTTFTVGVQGSFMVETLGTPVSRLTQTGFLPAGVSFTDNQDGTATLAGIPATGSAGNYALTINASNGVGAAAQSFTLLVNEGPAITSTNTAIFALQAPGAFTVMAMGTPAPALTETGNLPSGVTFLGHGNGSAEIKGTPASGTGGQYGFTIRASNGVKPDALQSFTLTVGTAPTITSANATAFTLGVASSFMVTAAGMPTPTLTESGPLPGGVTFDGTTGKLSGTPAAGTIGTYPITFTAHSVIGPDATQSFTLTVNPKGTSTVSVSSQTSTTLVGQAVTLSATFASVPGGPGAPPPEGTISFLDGSATLATLPVAASVNLTTSALAAGSHSITAQYSGDDNYDGSISPQAVLLTVNKNSTTIGVTSATSAALAGQAVTFTANLTAGAAGAPAPGGTITFLDGTAILQTVAASASVDFTTSTLTAGTHSITVQYSGDANYLGSTSPQPVAVTINKSLTALSVGSSTPTALAGQQVSLIANLTVTSSGPGVPAPSGSVTFFDGSAALGTAPLVSSTGTGSGVGSATFTTSTLAAGSHSITVQYNGDANYVGSTSPGALVVTINKSVTAITVNSPAFSALAGQQISLVANLAVTATVPGVSPPGGTVVFLDGSATLGTAPLVGSTNTQATATFLTSTLAAGSHSITVQYSGDADYLGSTSPVAFTLTINKSLTAVSVSSPTSTALVGQQLSLIANLTVTASGAGVPAPGGNVIFLDGSLTLGTAPLVSSTGTGSGVGSATFTTSTLAAGSHSITVQYSGDADYQGSTSQSLSITIQNTPTGTSVSVRPVDASTGATPAVLTFANVTQAGVTSLSISNVGPATPSGFTAGTPPTYFNLSTTAVFQPPITVCINYAGISFPNNMPALFHYEGSAWVNVTTSVDSTKMVVCGVSASLSPFALFAPLPVLTITANSVSRLYGAADPAFSVSYSGFVNGDTSAVLSGKLLCTSNDTAASPVGSYVITCSGLSSSKYAITYNPGTLSVMPTPLTVTAGNAQRVYGAVNPQFTGTITGIQNGDNITATYATVATPTSPVGTYAILPTLVDPTSKLGNYTATKNNGVLTVVQAMTSTTLNVSPNPSNFGQAVTLAAKIAPVAPGAGTATGKVTFSDGSVALGTSALSNSETATLTTSSLAAGNHNLIASYGGNPNFSGSSSSIVTDQVVCGVVINLSPSTAPLGATITVTGNVISCATTTQTVVVQFSLNGPAQPNNCSSTKTVMFTTPPFTLAPKTSQTISFPFKVPTGVCPGTYSTTAMTLVNGVAVNSSTASLTVTAH